MDSDIGTPCSICFGQNAKTCLDGPDKMPTKKLGRTKCQPQKKVRPICQPLVGIMSGWHFVRLAFCPTTTMGFNVELVRHKGVEMEIWDVGGADKFRPLLVHYYKGNVMDAIVYIVDSTDRELFPLVRQELRDMAVSEDLVSAHLLVLANKPDLEGAISFQELWDELSLGNLGPGEQPERVNLGFLRATALPICVTSGQGCQEALDWVANVLKTSAWK